MKTLEVSEETYAKIRGQLKSWSGSWSADG